MRKNEVNYMKLALFLNKILPLLFWTLLMLGFDSLHVAVLTGASAAIHECGHLIAIPSSKKGCLPEAHVSGFRIKVNSMSYKEELITAAGGPLINITLGVLLLFFPTSTQLGSYVNTFGIINLLTAISNLLPIEGYDGYKILFCIGALVFDDTAACERILSGFSFVFSSLMCFLSLYLILKLGEGYWIFVVFFSVTLSAIMKRAKRNF